MQHFQAVPFVWLEIQKAGESLDALAKSIKHRSNAQQYRHVVCRIVGDISYRGMSRHSTEEFNLAGNLQKNARFVGPESWVGLSHLSVCLNTKYEFRSKASARNSDVITFDVNLWNNVTSKSFRASDFEH